MVAEYLNVTVGYISQLERGITKINLDTLDKIATYLGTDISLFITGVVPQQKFYLDEEVSEKIQQTGRQSEEYCSGFDRISVQKSADREPVV